MKMWKKSGAGLAEADFGAGSQVELKLEEDLGWQIEKARSRIISARR